MVDLGATADCTRGPAFPPACSSSGLIWVCGLTTFSQEAIKFLGEGGWVERFRQIAIKP